MRFWLRAIGVLLLLAGLAGGSGYAAWQLARRRYAPPAPERVRVEEVTPGSLTETISATGVVQPRRSAKISAKTTARIVALPVAEGDRVSAGQPAASPAVSATVLVRLDDRDLLSRLRAAQASREAMAAQLEVETAALSGQEAEIRAQEIALAYLERDVARKQALLASQDIAQVQVDELDSRCREAKARLEAGRHRLVAARTNLQVLSHRLEVADAEIEQAREVLSYTTITAPIDGTVISLNAQVGEMVVTGTMNNAGTVIMEIADLDAMIVVAEVDEADVGKVAVGQAAVVHVQAYPDHDLRGQIETIARMHRLSARGTRYYRTEIRLDPAPVTLYSGLTANVDISTREHGEVLTVPSQAVLGRKVDELPETVRQASAEIEPDKTYAMVVYRVLQGRAIATPVRLGAADMTRTVILAGLERGDTVVTGPYKVLDKLAHDREVVVEGADPAPPPVAVAPAGPGAAGRERAGDHGRL